MTYLRPDVEQAERTQKERDAGVERRWVCSDSTELKAEEVSFAETGVDGRFVYDMEDELASLYGGTLEVVVSGGGASLSGQLATGPKIWDIAVENMSPAE